MNLLKATLVSGLLITSLATQAQDKDHQSKEKSPSLEKLICNTHGETLFAIVQRMQEQARHLGKHGRPEDYDNSQDLTELSYLLFKEAMGLKQFCKYL